MKTMEEKKCPACKKMMSYDYHYHCFECNCGKCYNAALQELAPRRQWQDEYDQEDCDY